MFIYLERFIQKPELIDELKQDQWAVVYEVYKYVESKLKPLEDEINAEEKAENPNMPCMILIVFPKGVKFVNYSKPLREKMKHRFDDFENDFKVLRAKLRDRLGSILN